MAVMAYSPLGSSLHRVKRLLGATSVRAVADRHGATPAQVALAWTLRHDGVYVIPKAAKPEHVRENRGALELALTPEDLATLDAAFRPPRHKVALELL